MIYNVKLTDVQSAKVLASVKKRLGVDDEDKRTDAELVETYLFGQLDGIVKYDAEQVARADAKGL